MKSLDHGGYKNSEIYEINSAVKNHNATENKKQLKTSIPPSLANI